MAPRALHAGGTAGLGLLTASHLAGSGAGALLLLGRSGRAARPTDLAALLRASPDACITLLRADVTGLSESQAAVSAARRCGPRLGGIVHAAGLQARMSLPLPNFVQFHGSSSEPLP
jgi:NAD(P)-dependent dehydrogenase (short-subunit alcohol dehydrogenase family)